MGTFIDEVCLGALGTAIVLLVCALLRTMTQVINARDDNSRVNRSQRALICRTLQAGSSTLAVRIAAVILVLLGVYVLCFGPCVWLASSHRGRTNVVAFAYSPLIRLSFSGPACISQ